MVKLAISKIRNALFRTMVVDLYWVTLVGTESK